MDYRQYLETQKEEFTHLSKCKIIPDILKLIISYSINVYKPLLYTNTDVWLNFLQIHNITWYDIETFLRQEKRSTSIHVQIGTYLFEQIKGRQNRHAILRICNENMTKEAPDFMALMNLRLLINEFEI